MEFFKKVSQIRFMEKKAIAFSFSILLCLSSLLLVATQGLHLGLDFTGGTQIELCFAQPVSFDTLRKNLTAHGFHNPSVQSYGSNQTALIRLGQTEGKFAEKTLKQKLRNLFPSAKVQRIEYIGPQVGQAMLLDGGLAILASVLITMVYIALRFEYRFAVSAALSLIHDPIVILGTFALFQLEFNLIALAALLTVLGYSLNDTIVVYDRIRENFRLHPTMATIKLVNLSINQTLSRTIMTSGLTLLVVIALCFLGGQTLQGFSIALIIGIVVGTYSSIYVAGALAVTLGLDRQSLIPSDQPENVEHLLP